MGPLRTALLAAVLALGAWAPAADAGEGPPPALDAGALEVRVGADPFALEFADAGSGEMLRTLGGALPAPDDPDARYGPLGYSFDLRVPIIGNAYLGYYAAAEAETVWFHATRVRGWGMDGDALVLDLATNDPLGHRIEARLEPFADGVIGVSSRIAPGSGLVAGLEQRASLSGAAFGRAGGERFLGFGERSNAVDQTGNEVFSWAEEGPFSSGEGEDLMRPLIPDFTFPTGPTATNFPVPWALSSRGLGLLVDQTQRSTFRLASERDDAWQAEAEAARFAFTVFAGPDPAGVVRRYSDYAGRQPDPAPWIFGPWVQMPREVAEQFRDDDVPVSVSQTYTHYLPCGAHVGRDEAEADNVAFHHDLGYKVTTYFNPHVCTSYQPVYDEAAANGWLVKNRQGDPYLLTNPFTADQIVSEVDFTAPGGPEFYGRLLDEAIDAGYDGWMEDFGEYTPTDSVFANGKDGLEMHNRYPVEYHCASYAHTRERMGADAAVFIRSGFHGVQPCARVVWGGDPTEDWGCADGLCAAVHQALSTGLTGVAYWGSDIGGFHAVVNPRTSDELNARWLQLGAVSGVMRTQRNGFSFEDNRDERSQVWSPGVLAIWTRYARLRTQLYPYIAAASDHYQRTGIPLSRHLALAYPDDPEAVARQLEFMFGPDLLAAPVVEEGASERTLYLPEGRWVDFSEAVAYRERNGAFLPGAAELVEGGRELTVDAPLEELPLFVRAGAVVPMLAPRVDTLADEGAGLEGLHRLGDPAGSVRRLIAFPRGRSRGAMDAGGTIRSVERRRRARPGKAAARAWKLDLTHPSASLYRLRASLATLKRPFAPCALRVNGERLPKGMWRYNAEAETLRGRFRPGEGSKATLRVLGPRAGACR